MLLNVYPFKINLAPVQENFGSPVIGHIKQLIFVWDSSCCFPAIFQAILVKQNF